MNSLAFDWSPSKIAGRAPIALRSPGAVVGIGSWGGGVPGAPPPPGGAPPGPPPGAPLPGPLLGALPWFQCSAHLRRSRVSLGDTGLSGVVGGVGSLAVICVCMVVWVVVAILALKGVG